MVKKKNQKVALLSEKDLDNRIKNAIETHQKDKKLDPTQIAAKVIEEMMDGFVVNYKDKKLPADIMQEISEMMSMVLMLVGFQELTIRAKLLGSQWRRVVQKFNIDLEVPKGVNKIETAERPGKILSINNN